MNSDSYRPTPIIIRCLIACVLSFVSQHAFSTDILREGRIAVQLSKSIQDGYPKQLEASGANFFAIYSETTYTRPLGGIIILHGLGTHPDWPDVIAPLRIELAQLGWATLSIQMPILTKPDPAMEKYVPLFKEVPARIEAAFTFFYGLGIFNIVIVGHDLGATMAARYLAAQTSSKIVKAFVGIGMSSPRQTLPQLDITTALQKIPIPVLDIYGSADLPSVIMSANTRAIAIKKSKLALPTQNFRQLEIPGANHFFTGLDHILVSRIAKWLKKYAPAVKFNIEDTQFN